jgi:hypothetical protein
MIDGSAGVFTEEVAKAGSLHRGRVGCSAVPRERYLQVPVRIMDMTRCNALSSLDDDVSDDDDA